MPCTRSDPGSVWRATSALPTTGELPLKKPSSKRAVVPTG